MNLQGLRILVLTNLYPAGVIPARGAFVENQVRSLRDVGCSVEVIHIDGKRSRSEYLRGAARLVRAASPGRFDLVHAHYGLTGVVGTLQKRLPLIVAYLGSDLFHPLHRRFSLYAARRADCNIVKSRVMQESLDPIPSVIIPSGTDLDLFRPLDPAACRRTLGWGADEFVALFPWDPGRPEKNHALAAAAVEEARDRAGPRLRLEVFHGRSQEEYNTALNASDVCLLTSNWEGSPNAVRESLAVGLPVVSVPVGDVPTVLRGVGHCSVAPADPKALGAALRRLAGLRGECGLPIRHSGREGVMRFSLRVTAMKLARLYSLVIGGERSSRVIQGELDRIVLP